MEKPHVVTTPCRPAGWSTSYKRGFRFSPVDLLSRLRDYFVKAQLSRNRTINEIVLVEHRGSHRHS